MHRLGYEDARKLVGAIAESNYEPSEWENDFLDNMASIDYLLTEKQTACLEKIYTKAFGGGRRQESQKFKRRLLTKEGI